MCTISTCHLVNIIDFSAVCLLDCGHQGFRPSGFFGFRAEVSTDVSPWARVLPEVAPWGGDYSQRVIWRRPEGGALAGLRPHQGAEGAAWGKNFTVTFLHMWKKPTLQLILASQKLCKANQSDLSLWFLAIACKLLKCVRHTLCVDCRQSEV